VINKIKFLYYLYLKMENF